CEERLGALALRLQPRSAMWRVIACAVAWALSGCGSEDCGELHQVIVGSSGTAPGTLLSGIRYETSASTFAVRSDGSLVCPTCSGLLMLDPELQLIGRAGPPSINRLVIAPDDAMYAVRIESGTDAQLFALSPAGQVRWQAPEVSSSLMPNNASEVQPGGRPPQPMKRRASIACFAASQVIGIWGCVMASRPAAAAWVDGSVLVRTGSG
ncbi:MAG TPA: hypothetical protein VF516_47720, partial [Kofleriaceae bacterium]